MKFINFISSFLVSSILVSACHHGKYRCCSGCNIIKTNNKGNWGVERGQPCFINENKCKSNKICKGKDCKVTKKDKSYWVEPHLPEEFTEEEAVDVHDDHFIEGQLTEESNEEFDEEKPTTALVEPVESVTTQVEPSTTQIEQPTEPSKEVEIVTPKYNVTGLLPVIEITTSSGNADSITIPVSRYVAETLASFIPNYVIPPEPYYEECTISITDVNGSNLVDKASANVKVRGNFSSNYAKKPLQIKFNEKQSILGMNNNKKFKSWILLASYKDISLVRDVTSLSLARAMFNNEYFASDTRYVEVTVNGEYMGVYIITEKPQLNKGRINGSKASEGYEGTDIGYLLEYDSYAMLEKPLQKTFISFHDQAPLKIYDGEGGKEEYAPNGGMENEYITIKSDVYSQAQHDFIGNFMDNVYNIMYEAAYNNKTFEFNEDYSEISENDNLTVREAIEKVVDVNSLVMTYILNEVVCNVDVSYSSFFMDVDFGTEGSKKLRFEAPWDFDLAYGNKGTYYCPDGQGLYAASKIFQTGTNTYTVNAWLTVLMYQDWYQDLIRSKWAELYKKGIFTDAVASIRENVKTYGKAFENSYQRWGESHYFDLSFELAPEIMELQSQAEQAEFVAQWLEKRIQFINNYWNN